VPYIATLLIIADLCVVNWKSEGSLWILNSSNGDHHFLVFMNDIEKLNQKTSATITAIINSIIISLPFL
jgi:hypothetical protein